MSVFWGIILAVIAIAIVGAMINSANQEAKADQARLDICERQVFSTGQRSQAVQACVEQLKREGY